MNSPLAVISFSIWLYGLQLLVKAHMDAVEFDVYLSSHVSERKRKTTSLWWAIWNNSQMIFSDRMVQIVHEHQLIKLLKFFWCMSCLKYIFQMLLKGWCIFQSSQVINKSKWFVHPLSKAQSPSCLCIKRVYFCITLQLPVTRACLNFIKQIYVTYVSNFYLKKNQVENNSFRSDSKI